MTSRIAAEVVVILHLLFILFVVLGGLLVPRWPQAAWLHLPAVVWGAAIELCGWICPLTPLENRLRDAAGGSGYSGGFVEHYIVPLVYPVGLTRGTQVLLGICVIAFNLVVYGFVVTRKAGQRRGDL